MSVALTLAIIFGMIFAIAIFVGFLYEKEIAEFERIVFKYIKLRMQARKAGLSIEEYMKTKRKAKSSSEKIYSNIISFDSYVA